MSHETAWTIGWLIVLAVVIVLLARQDAPRLRLRIFIKAEGEWIMAQAISVVDTHAPLLLAAQYVNAKGKVVPPPDGRTLSWKVSDPALATDSASGASDVVTLTGTDGSFTVDVTDGTLSDSLPVTVTPDQTATGIQVTVANP